jgi:nitrogen fixation/metabolism regulation signal transduction histidine kinase
MIKATRWAWVVSLVAVTGATLVLAFLLSFATNSPALYERHYLWLFWLNVAVAGLLALVILIASVRLVMRLRRRKFGSQLLLKLAAIFATVGVIPGVLIYTVSFQFVSRSIESWFDVRVEGALDAGLNLGRATLDARTKDLGDRTRAAAEQLAESGTNPRPLALERLREQLEASDVAITGSAGQTLVAAGGSATSLLPDRPTPTMLRQARLTRVTSQLEGLDEDNPAATVSARVRALALIPGREFGLGEQERFLLVTQTLPRALAANALAVQSAYREYQQRALSRDGLRRMYIGTLTLALVLAVFAAVLLAALLGHQLARPLLLLAEGVRQVARGDLSAKPVFASRDELGGLTRSFAEMTQQLADARGLVQRSVIQVEGARAELQTILDNLSTGVVVFDSRGRIDTVNPGATRILRLPLATYRRRRLDEVPGLADFGKAVEQRFELHAAGAPGADPRGDAGADPTHWQDSFELATPGTQAPSQAESSEPGAAAERKGMTLLVRGAPMPQGSRLLVFDDITDVVSAQRSLAWSEVARRLAHEIKNPLTPIQLSAERLQLKLEPKLSGADQAMLIRSVSTIVNQVQAMKSLVNEFRDYARLPGAVLVPLDLNALISEVLALYSTAQDAGRLHTDLDPELPPILGDGTQLRQVVHNLVQNALDAVADRADGRVRLNTETLRDDHGAPRYVRLQVIDNGPGFPEKVLQRAFEPYVTTKSKGTGLGLAVVKKIADEHGARARLSNLGQTVTGSSEAGAAHGAQVSLSFSKLALGDHPPVDAATAAADRAH